MTSSATPSERTIAPRHSILDLAPLELECMNALWPLGEGTVRDIHRHLAASCPRAYTTILTIMDRLAQKGIVTRQKVGRAFRYQPNVSAEAARASAVDKIISGFFAGSAEALALHLSAYRRNAPSGLNEDENTVLPAANHGSGAAPEAQDVQIIDRDGAVRDDTAR